MVFFQKDCSNLTLSLPPYENALWPENKAGACALFSRPSGNNKLTREAEMPTGNM